MQVNGNIDKNRKISVMGILNLTGDSYFAPSRCLDGNGGMILSEVIGRVGKMFEEGADIVDIGACSTRPGAALTDEAEEWRRLSPLMDVLRREFPDRMFSIDTFRAGIVENCFDRIGPFIINDISAGEDDPAMLDTAGRLGLTYIAMHKRGVPETMQSLCEYANVTEEIVAYFRHFERKAAASGITDWILDPGFGFAKTVGQNYQLLRDLEEFSVFGSYPFQFIVRTPFQCNTPHYGFNTFVLRGFGSDFFFFLSKSGCSFSSSSGCSGSFNSSPPASPSPIISVDAARARR